MSTPHIKVIAATIIALVTSLGTTSQTFASGNIVYSKSGCSIENKEPAYSFKHPGKIRRPNETGTIVNCPVLMPKVTSEFREHLSTRVSVVVKYHRSGGQTPLKCMVRWISTDNGQVNSTNSAVQVGSRHQGHSEFYFSQRVPRDSSIELRCEVPAGTELGGYRVW